MPGFSLELCSPRRWSISHPTQIAVNKFFYSSLRLDFQAPSPIELDSIQLNFIFTVYFEREKIWSSIQFFPARFDYSSMIFVLIDSLKFLSSLDVDRYVIIKKFSSTRILGKNCDDDLFVLILHSREYKLKRRAIVIQILAINPFN